MVQASMIQNFRDVGKSVNEILGSSILNEGILYRSGSIDSLGSMDQLPNIRKILNLRRSPDPAFAGNHSTQIFPSENMNNYLVTNPVFQNWIGMLFSFIGENRSWPILSIAMQERTELEL